MSLRSPTTCSYVSEATSFAMRHCTIAASPLPMYSEPDSFRSRHFIINQHYIRPREREEIALPVVVDRSIFELV